MPKRTRSTYEDADSSSEDANYTLSVDEDEDDASFTPKGKTKATKSKGKTTLKGKKSSRPSEQPEESNPRTQTRPHSVSIHTIQNAGGMRSALLKWYKGVHNVRGMPWRKQYDPMLGKAERAQRAYEVWISEIMLQQTQVATVIPYYNRWMEKFPTIRHLAEANATTQAEANIDEVNALWKGLGYYSRARRLLEGAKKAVKDFRGMLPDSAKALEEHIPGIGRYSAGAISSISYGERVPVLDGNVHRLLSRVLALHANPKAKGTLDILWSAAAVMVGCGSVAFSKVGEAQNPGDINQALIELGSTVCKVRDPDCGSCPLRNSCSAYRISTTADKEKSTSLTDIEDLCRVCEPFTVFEGVASYPMKAERKKAREELDIVTIIEWRSLVQRDNRHFLMVRRPEGGLLAGLYEFPSSVNVSKDIDQDSQSELAKLMCSQLLEGDIPPITQFQIVGDVIHVFSHIKKTYRVQWVVLESDIDRTPTLSNSRDPEPPTKKAKSRKKNGSKSAVSTSLSHGARSVVWVPLDEVENTNIGTGVVKVWSLAKRNWEANSV